MQKLPKKDEIVSTNQITLQGLCEKTCNLISICALK